MRDSTSIHRAGFSLVELLVVVAFIAILATIAVPHFASTNSRVHDDTVTNDVRRAMTVERAYHGRAGRYVAFIASNGERVSPPGYSPSEGVTVTATRREGGVRVVGSHPRASSSWCMNSESAEVVAGEDC